MSIYTEADVARAASNWARVDHLLADPAFEEVSLPRFLRRLRRDAGAGSVEEAARRDDLLVLYLVEAAHRALLPLAALATRRLHRLPLGQRETAPPTPDPCPRGPRIGARCAWTAMRDPDPRRRPWLARLFDRLGVAEDLRFLLIAQLIARGAWDLGDRLAVELAAGKTLFEWVGPLLRVSAAFDVEIAWPTRDRLALHAEDPLARLAARAHLAALDDDWTAVFASPPIEDYLRLIVPPGPDILH